MEHNSVQQSVEVLLESFSSYMRQTEGALQKLKQLDSLNKKGAIEAEAAKRLRDDYMSEMLSATEKFFEVEEKIEDLRARLKVEIEQGKRNGADTSNLESQVNQIEEAYMNVDPSLWVEIAISSLVIFTEARERHDLSEDRFKKLRETYKKFLDSMAEKWDYQKNGLEEALKKIEGDKKQREAALKELYVRHRVGEYDDQQYNQLASPIKSEYDSLNEKAEKIRKYVDAIDTAVFNCYYVYSHPEERGELNFGVLMGLDIPRIGDIMDVVSPSKSSEELYEKLYNYFNLSLGPMRAKSRLESEIAKYTSQGLSRSEAIRAVYKAIMKDRGDTLHGKAGLDSGSRDLVGRFPYRPRLGGTGNFPFALVGDHDH